MAPIKRKATAPCGSGPRQNEPLKLNPAAKGVAKRRKKSRLANAKRFFPQTGLKVNIWMFFNYSLGTCEFDLNVVNDVRQLIDKNACAPFEFYHYYPFSQSKKGKIV